MILMLGHIHDYHVAGVWAGAAMVIRLYKSESVTDQLTDQQWLKGHVACDIDSIKQLNFQQVFLLPIYMPSVTATLAERCFSKF